MANVIINYWTFESVDPPLSGEGLGTRLGVYFIRRLQVSPSRRVSNSRWRATPRMQYGGRFRPPFGGCPLMVIQLY